MPVSASYAAYIKDLFAPFGEIAIRKMFGGGGVYCDGAFFAIIGDDDLWLKADDETRPEFETAGLAPFEVEMKGKAVAMSYFSAPDDIFDDHDALRHWTGLALAAAARAKKPVKKKAKKA